MRRRTFLAAASATVAAACVPEKAAVSPSPSVSSTTVPTLTPTASPPPTPRADLNTLRASLRGSLLRPGDAGYDDARILYNTRFDGVRPLAVARCADTSDVQTCVRFARDVRMPLRIRSGGHSYVGASTGAALVIDLAALNGVQYASGVATVGAGARLIDVYDGLAAQGKAIAAGSCPTVGISGLTLGGGIGVLTRAWGLTCDQLGGADIVTADGQLRSVSAKSEPDLYWALKGGGGSFGVVTSLSFVTHDATDLALGFMSWDWSAAANVVVGWQRWMQGAPDALWSTLHLEGGQGGRDVTVHAVWPARASDIAAQLDRLVAMVGRAPAYRESGIRSYRDTMLLEAGCLDRPVSACQLKGTAGTLGRETYAASSVVANGPLDNGAIDVLVGRIEQASVGGAAVLIDALGGRVAQLSPDATAFPHRGAFAVVQFIASWVPGANSDASTTWLAEITGQTRKRAGTAAYANYPNADFSDWQSAYYGPNYPRLAEIKRRYDPDRVFDFPQAIG